MCKTILSTQLVIKKGYFMWTRLLDMLKRVNNKIVEHQQRRVAHWQLTSMTDNQLRDIGISRGDIIKKVNR